MEEFEKGVYKYFDVSWKHITEADEKKLQDIVHDKYISLMLTVDPQPFGYWIHVSDEITDDYLNAVASEGFSNAILAILKIASNLGCMWINLDCDGTEYPSLNSYDW
jgi:hypothetical protein